jgi:inner membrane protein
METKRKNEGKFSQSLTLKGFIIGALTLLLLIPNLMIQNLIWERKQRSIETVEKINEKWSLEQTICGPILTIPYTETYLDADKKTYIQKSHELHITPESVNINTKLFPEERYYSIYKTILYKSESAINGQFAPLAQIHLENCEIHYEKAYISIGISDLRGITNLLDFKLNGRTYTAEAGSNNKTIGKRLIVNLDNNISPEETLKFECNLSLNGSCNLNFIPVGSFTKVDIAGDWKDPGFIGSFSPEHDITEKGFSASWSILSFNRSIPENWTDNEVDSFRDTSFGVNLVDTVDHYQQNMRSAKYALMFIALTFVVFFFVEVLTKKRIHPMQYLLVGIALILFYSLLLSISEHLHFAISYLIASFAIITLITTYAHSIFKEKSQTTILALILTLLYIFLYVILQLEDVALLIGSIGLFIILGIIMFLSRKIKWYKQDEEPVMQKDASQTFEN